MMSTTLVVEPLPLTDELSFLCGTDPVSLFFPLDAPFVKELQRLETQVFPEAPVLFDIPDAGDVFQFLAVCVDGAVRHVVRISAPHLSGAAGKLAFFITDLISADPSLTLQDVEKYYADEGINLHKMISVETQFRLGEQLEPIRSADLAYLTLLRLGSTHDVEAVVAHLNAPAIKSFSRVGIKWHPFAGNVDLRTPTVAEDGTTTFDETYFPVCIPREGNENLLSDLAAATPKAFWISAAAPG